MWTERGEGLIMGPARYFLFSRPLPQEISRGKNRKKILLRFAGCVIIYFCK